MTISAPGAPAKQKQRVTPEDLRKLPTRDEATKSKKKPARLTTLHFNCNDNVKFLQSRKKNVNSINQQMQDTTLPPVPSAKKGPPSSKTKANKTNFCAQDSS